MSSIPDPEGHDPDPVKRRLGRMALKASSSCVHGLAFPGSSPPHNPIRRKRQGCPADICLEPLHRQQLIDVARREISCLPPTSFENGTGVHR
jgi:hypothetical protein